MTGESTPVRQFSWRGYLISAVLSAIVGLIFTMVFVHGRIPVGTARLALFGAVTGYLIGLPFTLVEVVAAGWLDRSPPRFRLAARAGAYTLAAVIGFGLSFPLGGLIVFQRVLFMPLGLPVTVATGAAALIALAIYSYQVMRERLEASLTRIKEQEFAEKELELARSIQQRLLPPETSSGPGYTVVARNIPARWVAGDFYDVFHLPDGNLGLAVADVAGKGIGASLIMSTAKAMLPLLAAERTVEETLRELNRRLCTTLGRREFVALALVRYDHTSGSLAIANAGLPNPYVLRNGGALEELNTPGPRVPLGMMRTVAYESLSVQLHQGERLMIYSDGLPEAPTRDGEPLGYEALERLIAQTPVLPLGPWIDSLIEGIRATTQDGLDDDCTVLVLERT